MNSEPKGVVVPNILESTDTWISLHHAKPQLGRYTHGPPLTFRDSYGGGGGGGGEGDSTSILKA